MIEQKQYWVHDLSPFLVRFPENPLGLDGIRYYGLAYLLSFAAAWFLLKLYDQKGRLVLNAEARTNLMTALIIGVLLGGRLGYMLLYDLPSLLQNPLLFFRVDQGGMASHGGFVGVILALAWFAHRQKCGLLQLGDAVASIAPLGLMLGRIANFINGELWGKVTSVSWAAIFPNSPRGYNEFLQTYGPEPRHPSQLYAAFLEGALLFGYLQWRFWKSRPPAGQLGGECLVFYGVVRIFGEIFREPDASLLFGLSRGQFYSIFFILLGVAIIRFAKRRVEEEPSQDG